MASLGRERRGYPQENSQPPHVFDLQAFREAIDAAVDIIVHKSVVAATTTQTHATVG